MSRPWNVKTDNYVSNGTPANPERCSFTKSKIQNLLWPPEIVWYKVESTVITGQTYLILVGCNNMNDPILGETCDFPCPNDCQPPNAFTKEVLDKGHLQQVFNLVNSFAFGLLDLAPARLNSASANGYVIYANSGSALDPSPLKRNISAANNFPVFCWVD